VYRQKRIAGIANREAPTVDFSKTALARLRSLKK
jgi:hypothetical protein